MPGPAPAVAPTNLHRAPAVTLPGPSLLHTLVFPSCPSGNRVLKVYSHTLFIPHSLWLFLERPGKGTLASQDTSHPGWTAQDGIHPKEGSQENPHFLLRGTPRVNPVMGYNQVKMSRRGEKDSLRGGTPSSLPLGRILSASRTHTVGRRSPHGHGKFGRRPGPTGVAVTLPRRAGGSNGKGDAWGGVWQSTYQKENIMRGRGPVLPSLAEPSVEWKAPKHLLRTEIHCFWVKCPVNIN